MKKIILSENEILEICKSIAHQLENKYKFSDSIPVFVGVMKGAIPFMMDLLKVYTLPVMIDFIQVSSYNGTESTGTIVLKKDVSLNLKDKDVVLVEDIVDSGLTMNFLKEFILKKYSPKSITTVALLDKKCQRKIPFELDYIGKEIPNEFVIGYGLDYNDLGRNVPFVFVPEEKEIREYDLALQKNR